MLKKLLNISDLSKEDFFEILELSKNILPDKDDCLKNKNIGLIFEKNSTRTRLSFQVGINQLSGRYIDINLKELNLQRIESFEDTFKIMSCYLDGLVYRTTDHKKLELALKFFNKPLINALSDFSHPCQALSDIYTLREHFGRDDDFNLVWCGDLNNVLFSLIESVNYLNSSKIAVFTDEKIFNKNYQKFKITDKVSFHFDFENKILEAADCIMTDVFNSMNDVDDKEEVLKKFKVNQKLFQKTNEHAIFMHCLPAKIGSEVSENIIYGSRSIIFQQAKNRMVAQRGIMKWLEL